MNISAYIKEQVCKENNLHVSTDCDGWRCVWLSCIYFSFCLSKFAGLSTMSIYCLYKNHNRLLLAGLMCRLELGWVWGPRREPHGRRLSLISVLGDAISSRAPSSPHDLPLGFLGFPSSAPPEGCLAQIGKVLREPMASVCTGEAPPQRMRCRGCWSVSLIYINLHSALE